MIVTINVTTAGNFSKTVDWITENYLKYDNHKPPLFGYLITSLWFDIIHRKSGKMNSNEYLKMFSLMIGQRYFWDHVLGYVLKPNFSFWIGDSCELIDWHLCKHCKKYKWKTADPWVECSWTRTNDQNNYINKQIILILHTWLTFWLMFRTKLIHLQT